MNLHSPRTRTLALLFAPLFTTACGEAFVATTGGGGQTTTTTATGGTGGNGGTGGSTTTVTGGTGGTGGSTVTGGTGGTGGATGCMGNSDCGIGQVCMNGMCVCGPDTTDCGAGCVDLQTDKKNCGACGNICGNKCVGGTCDDPVNIAAGAMNTCAVLALGDVYCWGRNNAGQLGGPVGSSAAAPVKVPNLPPMQRVFVGKSVDSTHACASNGVGDLYCWGSNQAGKLGINDLDTAPKPPTKVMGVATVHAVGLGILHSMASNGSKLLGWGANDQVQLGYVGLGTPAPNTDSGEGGNFVAAGGGHSCGVSNMEIRCWGRNLEGQIGAGNNITPLLPTTVSLDGQPVADAALGEAFTCARTSDNGSVICWGANTDGQLGVGNTSGQNKPGNAVNLDALYANSIAAGAAHAGAIAGSDAYVWGRNTTGQVDSTVGSDATITSPFKVPNLGEVTALALGAQHSCVLQKKGIGTRVLCWGGNGEGQVGTGAAGGDHKPPTAVQFP